MFCENCGKQLIRGYSFCIECGSPVPPEVLEEGGLPGRSGETSEDLSEKAENSEKTAGAPEENSGDVQASMPGIEPIGSNKDEGTLVFCPNCGMRMQHNLDFCEKCGMKISDKPSQHSVPLINNNPMNLDGSFNAFGGGIGDFSNNDLNQLNSFMGGGMPSAFDNAEETENLFGSNSYSANDMAILNQQISNFSASSSEMPAISKSSGTVRQQEPKDGETRKVENFSMSDVSDEDIPISDGAVPVIEGCSMDEDHSADVSLDPYSFLGNSMEEPGAPSVTAVNDDEVKPVEEPAAALTSVFVEQPEVEPVAVEPVAVAVDEVEPVEEIAEVPAEEPVAVEPVAVAVDEVAPVEDIAETPVEEPVAVEPVAVAVDEPAQEAPTSFFDEQPEVEPVSVAVDEVKPVEEPAAEAPTSVFVEQPEVEPVEEISQAAAETPAEEIEKEVEPMSEESTKEPVTEENPAEQEIDDFIPEEMGFIAETAPIPEETEDNKPAAAAVATAARQPVVDMDFRRPNRPQDNAPEQNPDEETPKGNLVYCRTCGQDMYDTEKFCKNCGATYKGAYVPPKSAPSKNGSKPSVMVFGKIPLAKFNAILGGIVGVAAAVLFLVQPWRHTTSNPPIGGESQSSSSSVITPPESSSSTSSENSGVVSSSSSSSAETSSSVSSSSTESSSSSSSSSASSSSSKSSSSTKTSSSSKSSSSSSTNPAVTTDVKLKALEQDREKIMYAAELIAGEVGKMDAFSQHVVYAMNTSTESNEQAIQTFYTTKFATNMLSNLSSGKSSVERAISSASPANREFSSLYSSLKTLKSKYDLYYNYITSPKGGYSSFTKNCQSYAAMVTSTMSSLNLSKFTTNYTAAYKNSAYAAMISDAVSAIKNCTTQLSLLQSQLSGLDSFERKAFNTLSADVSAYASALSYASRAKAYSTMLNGVSSDYSSALKYVDNAYNALNNFLKTCSSLPKTSASSFSSNISLTISTAKSYANSAARVIS
ncbi:MAG: zinc ribbon domain-containing protein [[Eubacterium] saphenum]|nr:zinc ribbon domain-containing protein [[Eubacterium] saphenum]